MATKLISNKSMLNLLLAVLIFGLLLSCASVQLNQNGWMVLPDVKKATLTISHVDLGLVVKDVQLSLKGDEGLSALSDWSVKKEQDELIITTNKPTSTTWNFKATEQGLNISCSANNGVLLGIAPACEDRIPARAESQDNGILYTSIGSVSAKNLCCLFDRETDIIIHFPEASDLSRNAADEKLMDITFPIIEGAEISLIHDYYINELGLKYYQPMPKRFKTAPVCWSSWYCYYMGTTEADMVAETDALAKYLKPYGLEYVQLDACYTRGDDANYLEWTKETFPQGGKWLFQYITSKGLKPALWVNIYGSNYAKAECADKYPDNYYLRDKDGKLSGACCTADTTVVRLDYTNPEVIEKHLKPMFKTLVEDWGTKYLKDAGWGTWMDYYDKNKAMAFDSTKGSREVYLEVQKALRGTVGENFYIGGCAMHELGLCFGIFDGCRTGGDDKAVWYPEKERGMSMQTFFNSLFGANYLNNVVWQCDPDAAMVRNPLTLEEGRTIVTAIALTGQLYMASDFMAKLPEKKIDLYRKTMPSTRVVPIDLYPYKIKSNKKNGVVWCCPKVNEYPRAIDLKVNAESGIYDVVAVFNWGDQPDFRKISLEKDLGLTAGREYLVFDFWNQKLKEITNDNINSLISAHGTRVYVIRPLLEQPQLLATSRHITGTVSIKQVDWDSSKSTLSGVSEIVAGAPYSFFIHVPNGMKVSKVSADTEVLFHKITDEVLEVKLAGDVGTDDQNIINWSVEF